jgi:hypothetical protein
VISNAKGNQVQITSYYELETTEQLRALSKATRVPQAAYLREALSDLLKKTTWQKLIPGCFGQMDVNFGVHPLDKARAKEAIKTAQAAGATFEEFEREVVWHCYREYKAPGMQQEHIAKQVSRAKRMWG